MKKEIIYDPLNEAEKKLIEEFEEIKDAIKEAEETAEDISEEVAKEVLTDKIEEELEKNVEQKSEAKKIAKGALVSGVIFFHLSTLCFSASVFEGIELVILLQANGAIQFDLTLNLICLSLLIVLTSSA